jgi:hypothetical protein
VLVCYLDDSGKDKENPITCLAGYAASDSAWAKFETEIDPVLQEIIGATPIHAMDLHQGRAPYAGWKVLQKQALVAKLCLKLYPLTPLLGVSFSVRKASYATRAAEAIKRRLRKRTATPYSFAMQAIINWLLTDWEVGKMANEQGLALILECGNEHNEEAKLAFDALKTLHKLEQLRSISFVPKEHCRAIQMADLLAFYTRRHNRMIEIPGHEPDTDPVLKVLLENLRQRSFVATDFGPEIKASKFFSGWQPS